MSAYAVNAAATLVAILLWAAPTNDAKRTTDHTDQIVPRIMAIALLSAFVVARVLPGTIVLLACLHLAVRPFPGPRRTA